MERMVDGIVYFGGGSRCLEIGTARAADEKDAPIGKEGRGVLATRRGELVVERFEFFGVRKKKLGRRERDVVSVEPSRNQHGSVE
jgi:hypothetical protein